MSLVADAARVATGVWVVAAECTKGARLQDLGSFAFHAVKSFTRRDAHVGDFTSSEAAFQQLREKQGAMDNGSKFVESQGNVVESEIGRKTEGVVPQPEELFAPSKAAESKEARPFKDVEQPLAPKVALPSVDANFPSK